MHAYNNAKKSHVARTPGTLLGDSKEARAGSRTFAHIHTYTQNSQIPTYIHTYTHILDTSLRFPCSGTASSEICITLAQALLVAFSRPLASGPQVLLWASAGCA